MISGTGPVNYLRLTRYIGILSRLFARVILPSVVLQELSHSLAPAPVKLLAQALPGWIEVVNSPEVTPSAGIHRGEAAERALIDFVQAATALEQTTFRMPAKVMRELLKKHRN